MVLLLVWPLTHSRCRRAEARKFRKKFNEGHERKSSQQQQYRKLCGTTSHGRYRRPFWDLDDDELHLPLVLQLNCRSPSGCTDPPRAGPGLASLDRETPRTPTGPRPHIVRWSFAKERSRDLELPLVRCRCGCGGALTLVFPIPSVSLTIPTEQTLRRDFPIGSRSLKRKFDLVALFVIFKRRHPIFRETAAYGHFGRDDPDFTRKKLKKLEKKLEL